MLKLLVVNLSIRVQQQEPVRNDVDDVVMYRPNGIHCLSYRIDGNMPCEHIHIYTYIS